MGIPSAYISTGPDLNSKFGHHDVSFATLPTFEDFHHLIDQAGGIDQFIQIDMDEILGMMIEHPDALLTIKIPTLGFTDPVFDYDVRPWFALPIGVNGFGAQKSDIEASRPFKLIGEDIMGNQYPLLFDNSGKLDYNAIAKQVDGSLYTTLKSIHYVYNQGQLIKGEGLTKLPKIAEHQGKLLMLAPQTSAKSFEIELDVMLEGQSILQHKHFVDEELNDVLYHINQMSIQTTALDDGQKVDVQIDSSAYANRLPSQLALSIELPDLVAQDGMVNYNQTDLQFESFKTTQYFGLSEGLLDKVLDVLIPKAPMAQAFAQPSQINDWSDPQAMEAFYNHIKQSIADTSLPIMALSDYLASSDDIKAQMRALNIETMTKPDHDVFTALVQSMYHDDDLSFKLADSLDQLLTLDKFYPQTSFSFMLDSSVDLQLVDLHLNVTPIGSGPFESQSYKLTEQGLINLKDYQPPASVLELDADPYFSESGLEQAIQAGQRFEVGADTLVNGAQVIHDFNWENNDVIDLNQLFENLGSAILDPAVVTEQKGDDVEIWVEDTSGLGAGEKVHVATVVGININDDSMPSIEQFVEFPS